MIVPFDPVRVTFALPSIAPSAELPPKSPPPAGVAQEAAEEDVAISACPLEGVPVTVIPQTFVLSAAVAEIQRYRVSKYVFKKALTSVHVVRISPKEAAESCPLISSAFTRADFAEAA